MNDKYRKMTPLQYLKWRKHQNAVPGKSNVKLSPLQELLRQEQRNKNTQRSDYLRRLVEKNSK